MIVSILLIAIVSLGGIALTYYLDVDEPMLWRASAGVVVGQAIFGTALFLLSFILGLTYLSVIAAAVIAVAPVLFLRRNQSRKVFEHDWARAKGKLQSASYRKFVPFLYYFGFVVFFILFFDRAMMVAADGIYTGGSNNLGDLPFHLGIIYSFTDAANFPPQNPSFAGAKFAYPFIADLVAAALVKMGAGVREAMLVQNVSWAFALLVILERFVFRLVNDRLAARIAPFLLFLSGGLGFLWFFSDYAAQSKSIFQLLKDIGKDYTISQDFRWGNSLITLFLAQRSLLLGMPLTLIILGGLWKIFTAEAQIRDETKERLFKNFILHRSSLVLGLLAGMLSLIHLHSLFVLFVVTGFLLLMRPERWREFAVFGAGVSIIAVPELIWSITGSASRATEFFAFYSGWESSKSNILFAWLKNTGIFIPILITGLCLFAMRREKSAEVGVSERKRSSGKKKKVADYAAEHGRQNKRSLLLYFIPFAFLFVLANFVKLAPWEWDNIKVLIYWFIGSLPFVAFVIAWLWERRGAPRVAAAVVIFVLTASGGLDVWRTVSRQHNYRVFDPDAIKTGERLRLSTPPDSIFLNAPTYNSATVLSGRLSLMRYSGHLGSHGIDYTERENDLKQMYRGGPAASALFEKYGVDYVLISPEERNTLTPNEAFFSRFPVVAEFGQYKVYDVRQRG
jgi:hypothetical protein